MNFNKQEQFLINQLNHYNDCYQQATKIYLDTIIDEKLNKNILKKALPLIEESKKYDNTLNNLCNMLNEHYKDLINKVVNISFSFKHNKDKQHVDCIKTVMFRGFGIFNYPGNQRKLIFPIRSEKKYDGTWSTMPMIADIVPDLSHIIKIEQKQILEKK